MLLRCMIRTLLFTESFCVYCYLGFFTSLLVPCTSKLNCQPFLQPFLCGFGICTLRLFCSYYILPIFSVFSLCSFSSACVWFYPLGTFLCLVKLSQFKNIYTTLGLICKKLTKLFLLTMSLTCIFWYVFDLLPILQYDSMHNCYKTFLFII